MCYEQYKLLLDVCSEMAVQHNAKSTRDKNTWLLCSCNLIDRRRRTLAEMKWTDWTWTSTTRRRTSSSASPPSSSSSPSLAAVAPGKWAIDLLLLQRWLFETTFWKFIGEQVHAGHLLHLRPPPLHPSPHWRHPRLLRRPQEQHQDTPPQVRRFNHY